MKNPCVYILTNKPNGTFYVGVTSNIIQRTWLHKNKIVQGFTSQHGLDRLVWYESHPSMESAIIREKSIKKWSRSWKIRLIEKTNPQWRDLYDQLS